MGDDLCPVGLCWTHHPPPRWGRPAFRFHLRLEGPLPTSELPTNFLLCQRAALCSCGWRPPAWALSTRLGLEGSYSSPEAHAGRRPRAPGRVTVPSYAAKLWGHFSQKAAGPAVEAPRPLIRLLLQDEHASSVSKATSMKYQLWPKETNMLSLACHTTQRCSGWQCCAGPDSALGTAEDPPGMQGQLGCHPSPEHTPSPEDPPSEHFHGSDVCREGLRGTRCTCLGSERAMDMVSAPPQAPPQPGDTLEPQRGLAETGAGFRPTLCFVGHWGL